MNRLSVCLRHALGLLCLVSLGVSWSAAHAADEPPRYKLAVGQRIVYRTNEPPKEVAFGKVKYTRATNQEWTFDVIDELDGGGWRLFFLQKSISTTVRDGNEQTRSSDIDGYLDLMPDGRIIDNYTLSVRTTPSLLFPPLPPDSAAVTSTWSTSGKDGTSREFRATPSADAPGEFRFEETARTVFDKIYDVKTTREYTFDVERGLVTSVVSTSTQGWPARPNREPTVQKVELASAEIVAGGDREALRADLARYFEARKEHERIRAEADLDFAHVEPLLDKARGVMAEAREKLTLPAVQALADQRLAGFDQMKKMAIDEAARFAPLIDQPSPDWTTTDLDGAAKSLADYRGKVVLLDFWYRGCGWCVRSFPQLKQLVEDFKGQDFVLLGVNSDRNPDDARFVIEAAELPYATVRNGDPPKRGEESQEISAKYHIRGFPTLVILDGEGVVRMIHVGYSPNLREELGKKIRELLAKR